MPGTEPLQVFVDLSNVVKDASLGFSNSHAALTRWDRLRRVWTMERPGPVAFILVADSSLRRALSQVDQARLNQHVARGEADVVADADVEVLRRARDNAGIALSNDRFADHRRIIGLQRARLVGWVARGPNIRLQERSLDRLLSVLISARAQKQALNDLGLTADAPQLRYRWFCVNTTCDRDLVTVPRIERGSSMCPSCGAYLDRGEEWWSPIWLKILHGSTEVDRFVLEDGDVAYVGRGVGDDVISLADLSRFATDVMHLDERHLELRNERGRLQARDNRSARGTAIRRPASGQRNIHAPPMPMSSRAAVSINEGTKIVLARTPFTVQISGTRA